VIKHSPGFDQTAATQLRFRYSTNQKLDNAWLSNRIFATIERVKKSQKRIQSKRRLIKANPYIPFLLGLLLAIGAILLLRLSGNQAVLQSTSCPIGSPQTSKWAPINRWDSYVIQAIEKVYQEEKVRVPGNRIKAHMFIETGGTGNPNTIQRNPYGDAFGLMQITRNAWVANRLDFSRIMDPAYNVYAGTLELAVRYKNATCGKGWDGASYGYFGGDPCGAGLSDPVSGYTPARYNAELQQHIKELDSAGCASAPSQSPTANPTRVPTAAPTQQVSVTPTPVPTFHCLGGCPTPTPTAAPTPTGSTSPTSAPISPVRQLSLTPTTIPGTTSPWTTDIRAYIEQMRLMILSRIAAIFSRVGLGPTVTVRQQVLAGSVDITKYSRPPFNLPTPNGAPRSDFNYGEKQKQNLNREASYIAKHLPYLKQKVGDTLADPFLAVIWTGAIENIGGNRFFYNCKDSVYQINSGCPGGFYSGGWQVGWGIQVSQSIAHVREDFEEVYGAGSANNASKVQEVGQKVINDSASYEKGRITNPSTFPAITITNLISQARSGNTSAQQALAVLLMDEELGALVVLREIAGDIKSRNNWAAAMSSWSSYYSSRMQEFSNRMKVLADGYTGEGTPITPIATPTSFPTPAPTFHCLGGCPTPTPTITPMPTRTINNTVTITATPTNQQLSPSPTSPPGTTSPWATDLRSYIEQMRLMILARIAAIFSRF
jgi:hypothetical protein